MRKPVVLRFTYVLPGSRPHACAILPLKRYVKEITFDEGVKNDIDFHISRSKERHRMYFYKKKRGEDPSPFHKTLPELLKAVDRSIATFTPQDVVRFFHQVTMRHLRYTAASFKVSVSYKD